MTYKNSDVQLVMSNLSEKLKLANQKHVQKIEVWSDELHCLFRVINELQEKNELLIENLKRKNEV